VPKSRSTSPQLKSSSAIPLARKQKRAPIHVRGSWRGGGGTKHGSSGEGQRGSRGDVGRRVKSPSYFKGSSSLNLDKEEKHKKKPGRRGGRETWGGWRLAEREKRFVRL